MEPSGVHWEGKWLVEGGCGEAGAKELCRVMGNPISCHELSPGRICCAGGSAPPARCCLSQHTSTLAAAPPRLLPAVWVPPGCMGAPRSVRVPPAQRPALRGAGSSSSCRPRSGRSRSSRPSGTLYGGGGRERGTTGVNTPPRAVTPLPPAGLPPQSSCPPPPAPQGWDTRSRGSRSSDTPAACVLLCPLPRGQPWAGACACVSQPRPAPGGHPGGGGCDHLGSGASHPQTAGLPRNPAVAPLPALPRAEEL